MSTTYILKGGTVVNEGRSFAADILIKDTYIQKIAPDVSQEGAIEINVEGLHILPGVIDDQVHFREPGLTHKANIASEAMAAVAGGTTSFMEMPNTKPAALTQALLQDKYDIAAAGSLGNYSFFMGTSNDNLDEVLRTDVSQVCGVKVFMGSSTGNMLVDDEKTLRALFSQVPTLLAAHCEDEATVSLNTQKAIAQYGENIPMNMHPVIRSEEACLKSTMLAFSLAREYNTRFHLLHVSTAIEAELLSNQQQLAHKHITAEVCVHHLHFVEDDYARLGSKIKCNPAIKYPEDRKALWTALLDDRLDIIATDHAPHTLEEKNQPYLKAPAGLPLVQHSLVLMLNKVREGLISIEKVVEKMAHAPAICFRVRERGFIREGYKADLAIVNLNSPWEVNSSNILAKCGWSPFEGDTMQAEVVHTFVSGQPAMLNKVLQLHVRGERMTFDRQ
jgi:dihydroorotase